MPDGYTTIQSKTGRFQHTITKTEQTDNNRTKTTQTVISYAADGTQIKNDYYAAAEARDLAEMNGYNEYYKTEIVQKDGKFFVKVTVKEEQPIGFLADDYLKQVNDGTLKANNPQYFKGIHEEYGDGKTASDLNYKMKPKDSLLIPAEKVEIKSSPTGWFKRNIMHPMY